MSLRVTRVSELETHQRCEWLWEYKYKSEAKRPPEDTNFKSEPMMIGSAVHRGIEVGMLGQGNPVEAAMRYLNDAIGERHAARFTKGISTAISGVPLDWWHKEKPMVEDGLWVKYGWDYEVVEAGFIPDGGRESLGDSEQEGFCIVNGTPDFWWMEEDGIILNDFKSSAKVDDDKLLAYDVFNAQLDYYAVLLTDVYTYLGMEVPPIYKRHVLLHTQGKHMIGQPKLASKRVDYNRRIMLDIISRMDSLPLPSRSPLCSFCDFRSVCEVRLTGGSFRDMLEDWGGKPQTDPNYWRLR